MQFTKIHREYIGGSLAKFEVGTGQANYAPNFEKVGSILLSACPFVCSFVRPFKKNLKLGF